VRVHRSALVARKAVGGFERVAIPAHDEDEAGGTQWVVVLKGVAEKLPVSRRQQHVMREF
jgi:two-component system response regulator AlgR